VKVANRQAAKLRDQQLESLAAFANMGDHPNDWKKFQLKYPRFFPSDTIYRLASASLQTFSVLLDTTTTRLLLYRDHLRRVWTRSDPKGESLKILYGMERKLDPPERNDAPFGTPPKIHPLFINGKSLMPDEYNRPLLPEGELLVDGISGEISLEFGSEFQQSVFELMKNRWRARTCAQCARYFIADKTAQAFCSPACAGDAKRTRALEYWRTTGNATRQARAGRGKAK
jgi:hypothetical protein